MHQRMPEDINLVSEAEKKRSEPDGSGGSAGKVEGEMDASEEIPGEEIAADPPPLPRTPERDKPVRAPKASAQMNVRRLISSIGIGLPKNKYRVFLGKGVISPVSESKQFVAPLAEINKVRIKILEGDEERADRNFYIGEIGINGIKLREDGKAELEIDFSLSATGILTVKLKDRIGDAEGTAKYVPFQFRQELKNEVDLSKLPVEELSQKIDLLEEQMKLLKKELEVRGEV